METDRDHEQRSISRRRLIAGSSALAGAVGVAAGAEVSGASGNMHDPRDYGVPVDGTDATRLMSAFLATVPSGSTIQISGGMKILLSGTLQVEKPLSFLGSGSLIFAMGPPDGPGILVTAPGCVFDGVAIVSRKSADPESEERSVGILVRASDIAIRSCTLASWQNGIQVDARGGEYQRILIHGNRVLDLRGAGGGRSDMSTAVGEDRGDGITVWGSIATITGNVVTAAPDTDARIGIHCEGLSPFNTESRENSDAMVTIVGNTVSGPFRRSVVAEDMRGVVISGNTVSGATWFGMALIKASNCVIVGNSIEWSRSGQDLHGEAWRPERSALYVSLNSQSCAITDNVIHGSSTSAASSMITILAADGLRPTDILVSNNMCTVEEGSSINCGLLVAGGALRLGIYGNVFRGFKNFGILGYGVEDVRVRGNSIAGGNSAGSSIIGIRLSDAVSTRNIITDNDIVDCDEGIQFLSASRGQIVGNWVEVRGLGLDASGSRFTLVSSNIFVASKAIANIVDGLDGNVLSQNA